MRLDDRRRNHLERYGFATNAAPIEPVVSAMRNVIAAATAGIALTTAAYSAGALLQPSTIERRRPIQRPGRLKRVGTRAAWSLSARWRDGF